VVDRDMNTAYQAAIELFEAGFTYQWWVVAANSQDTLYSEDSLSFTLGNELPTAFSLLSPEDGLQVGAEENLTFVWSAATDDQALAYTWYLARTTDTLSQAVGEQTFLATTAPAAAGTYRWWVEVTDGLDTVRSTNTLSFQVEGDVTGLPDVIEPWFSVYPNPSKGQVQLRWTQPITQAETLQVISVQGKTVYQSQLAPGTSSVDLGHLAPGTYLLVLTDQPRHAPVTLVIE